jgi:hypothetical protein
MAITPLVTFTDIQNRFKRLVRLSGITSTNTLDDIAKGATGLVKKRLGYNPQVDSVTNLPSVSETLNGGRPVIFLLAPVDLESEGATITVKELGVTLTRRPSWPTPPTAQTGDYFVGEDGFTLYRLSGPGGRVLGIWGANSNIGSVGWLGNPVIGGIRQGGDYTDSYRGTIEVTYTPDIDLFLIKSVALKLCKFELMETIASNSVRLGDAAQEIDMPDSIPQARKDALSELPTPLLIGTGT